MTVLFPALVSLSPFCLQGVEFFDEKLNSLCMTWLVDHGECIVPNDVIS